MSNQCWGAEKAYQRDFFNGRYIGADVSSPSFDKAAKLYGAAGFKVDHLDQIGDAVCAALASGKPAVIDIWILPRSTVSGGTVSNTEVGDVTAISQGFDLGRERHRLGLDEFLMVLFHHIEIIAIVHHQPTGLRRGFW